MPVPQDPFDGEGSDPPGEPDPNLDWPPPLTLGNGLVHDSRYDLHASEYTKTFSAQQLVSGVNWADKFVKDHALKLRNGFRPTQVDAEVSMANNPDGSLELTVLDRSVYVSDDDANYKTEIKTFVFGSVAQEQVLTGGGSSGDPRPTSIDTFALPVGRVGATIAFVYDNSSVAWQMVDGQSQASLMTTEATLADKGYRPISIASRKRNGASEFAAVFVQDGVDPGDWELGVGYDALALSADAPIKWAAGYYPFAGSYEQGSQEWPRFNVLWLKRSPELKLQLRYNMDDITFEGEDAQWRQGGYHLEGACAYQDAGVQRYAGVWVRHDPYLRWQEGIEIDPMDPGYIAKYLPFHQQAILGMTLAGSKVGDFFRPSGTLHIFEGDDLVLNRSYTYAGSTYPETPLNATMALASVAKSITAAATVRESSIKGIPLTAPFAGAAGINGVATMASVPTIADVLRNIGGFAFSPSSYGDHALIDASPYGQYPITGKMMYDYAVLGGHLDITTMLGTAADPDSYWNLLRYTQSQSASPGPRLIYSNSAFSMLGELVRVQSGLSYEAYVRTNFLAPLNLDQDIYPDPGHRSAVENPTLAGLRSYLVNRKHAYNPVDCATDADCGYLACAPMDPNPNCTTPVCGPDNTCTGCATNGTPCNPKWACMADTCVNTVTPLTQSEPTPGPQKAVVSDDSPTWSTNAGPIDPSAPGTAANNRYAGRVYMGGAPLAAGGWHGDGASLGLLMYALTQTGFLMPQAVAAQLWNPAWWNSNGAPGTSWFYGLGWYARGNWVAMAGGTDGSMAIVLHNRAYNITVVYLTNVVGDPFDEFINPLLATNLSQWSQVAGTPQSILGGPFPCLDDMATPQNECTGPFGAY
ncbi:serine hydrolase [Enhygromyxa salina]|uniref:Beta-lactamase n=1 Tax=Enhygromyxa salina TaxID=215803 RepID=A0A2S9YN74_9BACT|nr:serine hydrolase [Enhygromyxa salina]PRQ06535.1 Beta-lactamase [Enhygromyxa salina]